MTAPHFLHTFVYSPERRVILIRYAMLAFLILVGLFGWRLVILSAVPPNVYHKDFIQEYLLAKAVLDGANPYRPLTQLANDYIPSAPNTVFPHPTPHPPPVILLSLPFGLMSYETATVIWLLFETFCFGLAFYLTLRHFNWPRSWQVMLTLAVCLPGWGPIMDELIEGQLMSLLLLLLTLTWLSFKRNHWLCGGAILGAAVSLKLIVWPLLLLPLLYRRPLAAVVAAATVAVANLAVAPLIGLTAVVDYYATVGGIVEAIYRAHGGSFAIWGLGWRLLSGTGTPVVGGFQLVGDIQAPPLLDKPEAAIYLSLVLLTIFLALVLLACLKTRRLDGRFAILVCASVAASPIAWSHYLALLILPLVFVGRSLANAAFPRELTNAALVILALLLIHSTALAQLMRALAVNNPDLYSPLEVTLGISFLTLTPLAAIVGLLCLVWYADQRLSKEA
jgi:alpha-1,2-mannosyltransferase